MPRVSIDGQDLPRVLRATVVITHNVPEADPPPPAQPAPHHTHPDFWKQAAGDALARNVPLLLPGRHSPPSSALGDLLKLGLAAHEGAKEAAAQSPLPASQSSLPAAQRPHDPLQTPRAEFVLLLPLDHSVDIARWALAPMGPSRFHRVTLQTLDRFGTPKHTWIMFRAYVHAYREAEYTPRPADPADGRRYVEVTLRGLLPPLTAYDGQNLVVVAPGLADQTAEAPLSLSSSESALLAQTQAATQSQAGAGGPGGMGGGRADSVGAINPTLLQQALSDAPSRAAKPAANDPCKDCSLCITTKPSQKDPQKKGQYQIIDNFGASDAWCINQLAGPKGWNDGKLKQLATLLFSTDTGHRGDGQSPDGVGLSLWRFNVGAGPPVSGLVSGQDADKDHHYLFPTWTQTECFYDSVDDLKHPIPSRSTRQQGQQRFLSLAYSANVNQFVAFVNSPPCWLTVSGLPYSKGDDIPATLGEAPASSNLDPKNRDLFAKFLVEVVKYLKKMTGSAQWYISPVNEPDNPWDDFNQEGCRYSTDDIKKVLVALDTAIKSNHLSARIIGPEANKLDHLLKYDDWQKHGTVGQAIYKHHQYGNYIKDLLGNNTIRGILNNRLVAHDYDNDVVGSDVTRSATAGVRQRVRQAIDAISPGASFWMSEYAINKGGVPLPLTVLQGVANADLGNKALGGNACYIDNTQVQSRDGHGKPGVADDPGITAAVQLATLMYYDLTVANASAWHWWTAVSHRPDHSALIHTTYNPQPNRDTFGLRASPKNVDYPVDEKQTILPTKMLWAFGNYSRFIRPGAQRVDATLKPSIMQQGVLASAYLNADSTAPQCVVVLVNPTTTPVSLNKLCNDIDVTFVEYYVTSATENLRYHKVKASGSIVLDARSVITLVSNPPQAGGGGGGRMLEA